MKPNSGLPPSDHSGCALLCFFQFFLCFYARKIIAGICEVRDLIYVMLKGDDSKFLRQLTDLIFGQLLTNAHSFFSIEDSKELRLYYELQSAGMAAFIIKWVLQNGISEEQAAAVLTDILLQTPARETKTILTTGNDLTAGSPSAVSFSDS
ncbi:MAG: hypothetical protein IKS37_09880 [Solobacterium sp.]|nr:hypothetical protein [Solobacterium sp.]